MYQASPLRLAPAGRCREQTFEFIQSQFKRHFAATIADDTPHLVDVLDGSGERVAAFGLRFSMTQFNARHYVGDVATRLAERFDVESGPECAVELTHLAAIRSGVLLQAAPLIVSYCQALDRDFLVCTATRRLRRFFACKRLAPQDLGPAHEHLLPVAERGRWGTYYDALPGVVAGDLRYAARRLHERTESQPAIVLPERASV